MGRADHWAEGDWNAVCFECGRKRKAGTLRKHWQGYYVCPEHWEPRQPQDFVRALPDNQTPPWVQPMPTDQFRLVCTAEGSSAVPELAMPGCMIPSRWLDASYSGPFGPWAFCPMNGNASRADQGAADCMTVGRI